MKFDPVYSRAPEREFAEAVSWYLRRVLVRGFDYAVLFRVTSGRPDITVVAVMHTRRSVSRWRLREPKAEFAVKGEKRAKDSSAPRRIYSAARLWSSAAAAACCHRAGGVGSWPATPSAWATMAAIRSFLRRGTMWASIAEYA